MIETRNVIVKGIHNYMDMIMSPQDQMPEKPKYPFLAYKFTSPHTKARGSGNVSMNFVPSNDERFEYDVEETLTTQPTMTLSISAYCSGKIDNGAIAYEAAKKAKNWFEHAGYQYLSDANIVVKSIEAFGDRTTLLTNEYESRIGFDVVFRVTDEIKRRYETIEEWNINTQIN